MAKSVAKTADGARIPALDGVRGLAILMVMAHHFTMTLGLSTRVESTLLFVTYRLGVVGVELFFVLSGFLITGILWDSKGRSGREKLRVFYIRRVLRIFPLYYGVILGVTLSGFLIGALATPGWHRFLGTEKYLLVYLTNMVRDLYGKSFFYYDWFDFSHFWSLAVEENFYLAWPFLLLWSNRRGVMMACGLLLLASLGVQIWGEFSHGGLVFALTATPRQAGSLLIGSALALSFRSRHEASSVLAAALPVFAVSFVAHAVLFANDAFGSPILGVLQRLLCGIMFAALIARLAGGPGTLERAIFESGFLRFFGKYSYGLYVFHHLLFPVWLGLLTYLARLTGNYRLAVIGMIATATTVSIGLSLLSWSLYERPILGLKRFFEYAEEAPVEQDRPEHVGAIPVMAGPETGRGNGTPA